MLKCITALLDSSRALGSLVVLGSMLFFCAIAAQAGEAVLAWDPNTEPDLGGYRLYYGQASHNYTNNVDVGKQTQFNLTGLKDGITYYFAVKAYDNNRVESDFSNEVSKSIPNSGAPTANFNATPTSGATPLAVTFTDTSTGNITGRSWDFGDGGTSTANTAVHTYTAPGNYNVSLTVSGPGGNNKSPNKTISVAAALPVANFSANPTSGKAPLAVHFQDASTSNVTQYTWNFGDGSTSTERNPTHTYNNAGNYTVSLVVRGAAGASSPKLGSITVSSDNGSGGGNGNKAGLVAAYSFDEAGGDLVADASNHGNTGTIQGAVRDLQGRFGGALKFDGDRDWVTIKDSSSLDLTTGMTLEAWVYLANPLKNGCQSIIMKERPNGQIYALEANCDANAPVTGLNLGSQYDFNVTGRPSLNAGTWIHLASTYDGTTQRLYVNGNEVANQRGPGRIGLSDGVVHIGGNTPWKEFFKGLIDEVRIYNRALSASEIQADMNTPVATSSPPGRLLGGNATQQATASSASRVALMSSSSSSEQALGQTVDALQQGRVKAFQTKTTDTGLITALQVYVNGGSTGTQLIAGIYSDNQGHPGALLAQETLNHPMADTWNLVNLPATSATAGSAYWIAILSPDGILQIRDKVGGAAQPCETSAQPSLTTLPDTWANGTACSDGPVSAYGVGYR